MNVLNIYRTYFPDPPGGLQEAIRQICLATSYAGVKNTIFSLSPDNLPKVINFPEAEVIREKSWIAPASCDIGGFNAFRTYKELANSHDLVHYFHPWPFADALNFLRNPNQPAVLTYISDVVRQQMLGKLYAPLMWRTLEEVDVIVANCPAYAETSPVLSHDSIKNKVRIIPLGIDENSYPKIGDESIFDEFGIVATEPYFLFLGVLRYYKGIHTLIEASKNINSHIVIAGSGPEEVKLKKQVDELGLKNVIVTGQVTDEQKVSLIKHCLALVLPSHLRSEAYGMVLVEASMFSKPMITCEIGTGTSFVNLHEKTGFVVEPENSNSLSDAMTVMLDNANQTALMGKEARTRYEHLFSGPALGKAYSEIYKELL